MKVTIKESGGLAPGMRRREQTIESESLPKAKAEELARLVEAAKYSRTSEAESDKRGRDAVSYTIHVEDQGESTELKQSDTTITQPVAELIEWVGQNREGQS